MGKFPNKGFGRPKAVLAPTNRQMEQASQKAFVMTKAVLAPTNGRTSIFGDLGFGYPKAVLAPTDRQTFFCRGKRNLALILLHKTQTRASVFASFRK